MDQIEVMQLVFGGAGILCFGVAFVLSCFVDLAEMRREVDEVCDALSRRG